LDRFCGITTSGSHRRAGLVRARRSFLDRHSVVDLSADRLNCGFVEGHAQAAVERREDAKERVAAVFQRALGLLRRYAGLVLHEGDEGLPGDGIVEQIGRLGIVGDAAMAFEARIGAQGRAQPDVAR